jgi:hydrogenase expression/formation protein HypD
MSIARNGLRRLLPETVTLISGPGCPVCVTSQTEITKFIALAGERDVIITTFGDLMRIPGSDSSLEIERAKGADIRMVYSPFDALLIADKNPDKQVVFLGVGFETTAPTIAATILEAQKRKMHNFSVISAHKLVPPALVALLQSEEVKVDGFICPGHVSVIIGGRAYQAIADDYHAPCVVAGFEPVDILQSIYMLVEQIEKGVAAVEVAYKRGVQFEGNVVARDILYRVFDPCDASWRGIGDIPQSGLKLRDEFSNFNAEERFDLEIGHVLDPKGCACGEILCGVKTPVECPLYKKSCTPEHPIGPCMVSSEGTCAAFHKYHHLIEGESD